MKALKTKVILSGIVLVFAFIATIGTTFAWFTVSQTATVDTMTLNVTSADSLLIMPVDSGSLATPATGWTVDDDEGTDDLLTASNYYTYINETILLNDYNYEVGASLAPWRLSPSTVVEDDYASYNLKTLNVIDDFDTRTLTSATANDENGDYLELKFWVLLEGEANETAALELIDTSAIASNAANSTGQANIANAVRMSIWASDDFFTAELGHTADVGDALVFGNGIDYNYSFVGDFVSTQGTTYDTLAGLYTGADEANLTAVNSTTSPTDHFDLATYVGAGNANPADIFEIKTNTPTLVTVLIYVEGWDAQTTNSISLAQFDISFGFEVGTLDA